MKKLFLKLLLLLSIVLAVIVVADRSGLFVADLTNNHEIASWNAFYDFTENNEVDVLLIGNSHLYTGINPNHLSCLLGANCFIIASSGGPIIDTYYNLKEALKRSNPKLIVVETYGINNKSIRQQKEGNLSDEFKSFSTRRDILQKIVSTPILFSSDNYLSAWSTSIRNHDFLFRDPEQIKKNKEGKNIIHKKKDLELGRFTRFTSGITAQTDSLYDALGPVVDGDDFRVNRESYVAVKKIQALAKKKDIPVVFLTVPMYHKHLTNYSSWKTIVSRVIGSGYRWLDLQDPYDLQVFDKSCFENTRNENQHISAKGARICDYKLSNYLTEEVHVELPDRHAAKEWRDLFYKENGYFENYSVKPGDNTNFLLCKKIEVAGVKIKDCIIAPYEKGCTFYLKVDKSTDHKLISHGIELYLLLKINNEEQHVKVQLNEVPGMCPHDHYLLMGNATSLTGITAAQLLSIGFIRPS